MPAPGGKGGPSLGLRVFGALSLVILAGSFTLTVVALLVAPTVFYNHLQQAGVTADPSVASHIREGFAAAVGAAIAAGVVASVAVAVAVALLVSRRIDAPVAAAADATQRLASGDYSARVPAPGMGPELTGLADSVNALAERLEQTEAARMQLVTDFRHELRTPLASIDATVEAVADGVLPADPETMGILTDQSRRLARLVDDLAAVSRADEHAFRLAPRPVDATAIAASAAAAAAARFAAAGVDLRPPTGPAHTVLADPDRLAEVLGQLLDNAARHCQPGDTVTLQVTEHGHTVVLTVTDTGRGVDPADTQRIFQRFYRANHDGPGTGIGLTIARALIHAQGGTLTAATRGPGCGAQFTINLPSP